MHRVIFFLEGGLLLPVHQVRPGLSLRSQIVFFFLLRTALKDCPLTANCQPPTTNRHQPPTTKHQPPPTANHQPPPTANHQTPTATNRQPPTATNRQPPTAANHQPILPATNHHPPIANHHQLPTANCWSREDPMTAVLFSLQALCLTHTGKPTGVAVSHCITLFQTQLILSLRVRSATTVICGIIVALDSSDP